MREVISGKLNQVLALKLEDVIIVNISGEGIDLINKRIVLGSMREVISGKLNQVLALKLEDIVIINVSGEWVNLVDQGIILWSVRKIISVDSDCSGSTDDSQGKEFH